MNSKSNLLRNWRSQFFGHLFERALLKVFRNYSTRYRSRILLLLLFESYVLRAKTINCTNVLKRHIAFNCILLWTMYNDTEFAGRPLDELFTMVPEVSVSEERVRSTLTFRCFSQTYHKYYSLFCNHFELVVYELTPNQVQNLGVSPIPPNTK